MSSTVALLLFLPLPVSSFITYYNGANIILQFKLKWALSILAVIVHYFPVAQRNHKTCSYFIDMHTVIRRTQKILYRHPYDYFLRHDEKRYKTT